MVLDRFLVLQRLLIRFSDDFFYSLTLIYTLLCPPPFPSTFCYWFYKWSYKFKTVSMTFETSFLIVKNSYLPLSLQSLLLRVIVFDFYRLHLDTSSPFNLSIVSIFSEMRVYQLLLPSFKVKIPHWTIFFLFFLIFFLTGIILLFVLLC